MSSTTPGARLVSRHIKVSDWIVTIENLVLSFNIKNLPVTVRTQHTHSTHLFKLLRASLAESVSSKCLECISLATHLSSSVAQTLYHHDY